VITALEAVEALEAWSSTRSAGKSTGFEGLDDVTGGFAPGQVWIIVGTPGQGRSTWASQSALHVASDLIPPSGWLWAALIGRPGEPGRPSDAPSVGITSLALSIEVPAPRAGCRPLHVAGRGLRS